MLLSARPSTRAAKYCQITEVNYPDVKLSDKVIMIHATADNTLFIEKI